MKQGNNKFDQLMNGVEQLWKDMRGNSASGEHREVAQLFAQLKSDKNALSVVQSWKLKDIEEDPTPFWNSLETTCPQLSRLCRFMITVANIPPVVTACDSFISILGCVSTSRRTRSKNIFELAWLKSNGDYTQQNPYLNWSAFDGLSIAERKQILEEKNKK